MKTKIQALVALILIVNCSYAQIRFHHRIKMKHIKGSGFDLVRGAALTPVDLCTMRKGTVTLSGGNINVDLWQIKDAVTCNNGIDSSTPITTLKIVDGRATFGRPTKVLWLPFQCINVGVNSLPFRYRFPVKVNNTEVAGIGTSSFQLAFNLGYTWGWSAITTRVLNNYSVTFGGYVGPSTADLKKGVYKDQTKYVADQTNATMTYGANIIFARNGLGLVFAFGTENALGKNAAQWIYNGAPYFAFGINSSFGK